MVDEFGTTPDAASESSSGGVPRRRRRAASRPAGPPAHVEEVAEQPMLSGSEDATGEAGSDAEPAHQGDSGQPDDAGQQGQPAELLSQAAVPTGEADVHDQTEDEADAEQQAEADSEPQPEVEDDADAEQQAEHEARVDATDQGSAPSQRPAEEPTAEAGRQSAQEAGQGPSDGAPASPPTSGRRPRRATRGVTTVAFSGGVAPEPAVTVNPPAEVRAIALFQPPDETKAVRRSRTRRGAAEGALAAGDEPEAVTSSMEVGAAEPAEPGPARRHGRDGDGDPRTEAEVEPGAAAEQGSDADADAEADAESQVDAEADADAEAEADSDLAPRRRRRRGGRRRRRGGPGGSEQDTEDDAAHAQGEGSDEEPQAEVTDRPSGSDESDQSTDEAGGSRRRRRRRRRAGVAEEMEDLSSDDQAGTVVKVREGRRAASDEITSVRGSTRIEAKRQRRRDGREAGRRRAPILTEAEFLARRESVNRVMCVREHGDRTQIAVLEDGILVEHYVNRAESSSMVGNVYLGKVQNVLPSMEAAFVDIGRGRNAVLYAGEVNWDAAGMEGQPKRIELALKSGDPVLVQVTKDPIGHKGARLTSQISLPGRFLVYVPEGSMTGISRKLPDTERSRLKGILRDVVPEGAGVIVRTAAEGATEEQLTSDVTRLTAQWQDITKKARSASPPTLLYGEPDLAIKVVRDIFNEDFTTLLVQGDSTWQTLDDYIGWVAPDLRPKLEKWVEPSDLYAAHRIDEQLAKALDRKVWLPSGGSLVIDRTEAMTVVDVNTGKFTGQGGNLEETVTRNNLEAAEEIVRQLRLRDIGGIVVIDFIDMVLESNRDLVLRRLVECLGRDRTKHQVAEVTSLGLVQMTRKRIGQGLLEVFSTPCEACGGRGHVVHAEPVGAGHDGEETSGRRDRDRGRRAKSPAPVNLGGKQTGKTPPPPKFDERGHIHHVGDHAHPQQAEAQEPIVEGDVEPAERDFDPVDSEVQPRQAAADEGESPPAESGAAVEPGEHEGAAQDEAAGKHEAAGGDSDDSSDDVAEPDVADDVADDVAEPDVAEGRQTPTGPHPDASDNGPGPSALE